MVAILSFKLKYLKTVLFKKKLQEEKSFILHKVIKLFCLFSSVLITMYIISEAVFLTPPLLLDQFEVLCVYEFVSDCSCAKRLLISYILIANRSGRLLNLFWSMRLTIQSLC